MEKSKPPSEHEIPQRVIDRFWNRVQTLDWWDCWPWLLSTGSHGYGQVGWWANGRSVMTTAHRVAYMAVNGPITPGMTVDHECRNPVCCNPLHLREKTNVDNARDNVQAQRGEGVSPFVARRT